MLFSKLFKHCNVLKLQSLLLAVLLPVIITSCENYEFNGEISDVVEQDISSIIYFKKDPNSPVAFSKQYKIGEDYSITDLPDMYSDEVWDMYPGYDLGGWKCEATDDGLQTDNSGYVTGFHMSPKSITLYGDGYTRSSRTPYTIIIYTQKVSGSEYDEYTRITGRGTTDDNTNVAAYLTSMPGFSTPSYTDTQIMADGSTTVSVYYERVMVIIYIDDPVTSFTDNSDYGRYGATVMGLLLPTNTGYTISSWKQILGTEETIVPSLPATYPAYDYTYTPVWTPISVPYTVYHMKQNTDLSTYSTYDTETKFGYTGSSTAAIAKTYEGFTAQAITQETIAGNGSTEVIVQYDRNDYTLTYNGNNATLSVSESTSYDSFTYGVTDNLIGISTLGYTKTGYSFQGWATTRARADAGTIDYADGASYTIGAGNVTLYAVWRANEIEITIDLPDAEGVGIAYTQDDSGAIILRAIYINEDGSTGEDVGDSDGYTFNWFYTEEGITATQCNDASWTVSLAPGVYQISLIAEKAGVPTGGTIHIRID